ncbi:hypothetical protein DYBT9275_03575 [Dyadobacter sp. CECT 9275]|uniref:chitinase n=1 Tax=Dyadobacter helix TaxID=2822344 RepID=A0A916JEV4_9BACT|nr:glycosyl hydrolase family 18 protein [Dyadobacter sp. CECT 9275]CAG5005404.1 hypothetical protein DYBT9275_03575 [Dyadobacter sp. CECT 9275]
MKKLLSAIIVVLIFGTGCTQKETEPEKTSPVDNTFRVIGYIHTTDNVATALNAIDLSKLTHINIAFINPDAQGTLTGTANLKAAADLLHSKGIKVMASIGGGNAPSYYSSFLTGEKQQKFIDELVKLAVDNNLDGIDVDLEGNLIDANYESFVTALATALRAQNKLVTAAIATVYAQNLTDKALSQFDFVNLMSYDKTGPWKPSEPGQHAPFEMAQTDLEYWTGTRGLAKEKITLGVPFYGYGFGAGAPESMSFKDLVAFYPGAANIDMVNIAGGSFYYNGIPTIKKKTALAVEKAGGIMIWQILQDAPVPYSLLNTIDAEIKAQ